MGNEYLTPGSPTALQPSRSPGAVVAIAIIGIAMIYTSISEMTGLLNYAGYFGRFQGQPVIVILLRYLMSWIMHLFAVVAGVGLFSHREFFRKAGIFLSGVAILAVFGKYSAADFVQYINVLSGQMKAQGNSFSPESIVQFIQSWNISWFSVSSLAWGCIAFLMIFDILMILVVLFVLTRNSVKAVFRGDL